MVKPIVDDGHWPRRSTKPDADGQAQHPLSKGVASKWYCLHCDAESIRATEPGAGWDPRVADPRGRAYSLRVNYKFF